MKRCSTIFGRLAERAPLVVQLEDLHWADAETLAATSYLLRATWTVPVTILATFRTDEITRRHPLRPWLAEIARDADVERIDLEPLGLEELGSLARNILGEDVPALELEEIYRRSDGNPFYAEELLCCRIGGGREPDLIAARRAPDAHRLCCPTGRVICSAWLPLAAARSSTRCSPTSSAPTVTRWRST